jgi:3-hydroxyisobutyrate dehydrogenase-like beta-hydroxyacid dehydrogenase
MAAEDPGRRLDFALVGYGEVGKILAAALVARRIGQISTYDILLREAGAAPGMRAHAAQTGVRACDAMATALATADVVICAVTASQTLAAATEAARAIRPGALFVDLNSASPGTKTQASRLIDGAGGRYVESAVMTAVPPYGIRMPMLLGGPHAAAAAKLLSPIGFSVEVVAAEIGVASAIKLCRSVFIKGLEAIVVESFTSARHYGVERHVLASLAETFPTIDWEKQGSYLFSRVAQHGRRRAEEMREAALTVREAGLDPHMAAASAERQDAVAAVTARGAFTGLQPDADWRDYADRILEATLRKPGAQSPTGENAPAPTRAAH